MTLHSYHPDTHTQGLFPGCPRCEEHATNPRATLDQANLARLADGRIFTSLDRKAASNLGLNLDMDTT